MATGFRLIRRTIDDSHNIDIRCAQQFDETKQFVAAPRIVGVEPDWHLGPIDTGLGQQPAEILKRQRPIAVRQCPTEFALLWHLQRRGDDQIDRAASELVFLGGLFGCGFRAHHPHDDAIEPVIRNFRLPFNRAFVSVGFLAAFGYAVTAAGLVDNQLAVQAEVFVLQLMIRTVEQLKIDLRLAFTDARERAFDDDAIAVGVHVARVVGGDIDPRQALEPQLGQRHATLQIAPGAADDLQA